MGTIRQIHPGVGTYVKGGHIYASLVGTINLEKNDTTTTTSSSASMTCSVLDPHQFPCSYQVLRVGQRVLGCITRITPQMALVEISVAEHVGPLHQPHEGGIRMEDVRAGASEQVVLEASFQPGDIVVARVLSLGDARRYYLSTAETELGVIRAMTKQGIPMVPISWKEMECPETGIREPRKCAKPIQGNQPSEQQNV